MKKSQMADECEKLLEVIKESFIDGTGEFLEGTLAELIPYLNADGLKYLKSELLRFKNG